MNGLLVIDKPSAMTSHDVVSRVRRATGESATGHLGTLDPMATGVLPVLMGKYTRLAQFFGPLAKTYTGAIRFGFATNTYDADGEQSGEVCPVTLALQSLQEVAAKFLGVIEQVPPPFSAKKIEGVPAYKLARKQKEVILQPVSVEIKEFLITVIEADRAHFRARVASGTYMRSIAHEMGQRLGCGAHLEALRRTAVGEFDITHAHSLEKIEDQANNCHSDRSAAEELHVWGVHSCPPISPRSLHPKEPQLSAGLETLFIHPRQLLPQFPSVTADEPTAARIRSGRPINLPELSRARQVKVFAGQRELLAIATRVAGTLFHPKIVFPAE